jgi:hypothetical protein
MVSNVTSCHAPAPEPPVPAALLTRGSAAVAAPASDALVSSHVPGAAVAISVAGGATAKKATSARRPASTGTGYASGATTPKTTTSRTTTAKTTATKTTSSRPAALAFLDDKNLSVEDKLLQLLAYLNKKWEGDIEKKMQEAAAIAKGSASGSGGSSSSESSPLSGIASAVTGAVKSLSGPALAAGATALGFPELAPLALKLGPSLVDGAVSLASSSGASPGASGSTSSASSGSSAASDREAQLKIMQIQRIVEQQNQMFSLVSNLLSARHQLRMSVIQNTK